MSADHAAVERDFRAYLKGLIAFELRCPNCDVAIPSVLDHGTDAGGLARHISGFCPQCDQRVDAHRTATAQPALPPPTTNGQ